MTGPSSARRVLIVEQNPIGHHFYYVRLLVDEARKRGQTPVLATTSAALGAHEFALHLGAVRDSFETRVVRAEALDLPLIRDEAALAEADVVVVPDGDALTMRLGRSAHSSQAWPSDAPPISLLVMREHGQDGRMRVLAPMKTLVKAVLIRRADASSGVQVVVLKPSGWSGSSRTAVAIDPVTIAATAADRTAAVVRLRKSGDAGTRWFGVFGALTTRKNLPLIAEALVATGQKDVGLVAMGHFDTGVRESLQPGIDRMAAAGLPVLIDDRWLGDGELDAFVGVVDCVVLAYSNEGPSGLLGKSIASGTKVLTAGARMLKHESKRYPGRAAWTPLTVSRMSRAMAALPKRSQVGRTAVTDVDSFAGVFLDLPARRTR